MKLKSLVSARARSDSGASAVEFALIFPLLCIFLLGIITYGYILSLQQAVTQAAAEGARAAAITAISSPSSAERGTQAKQAIDEIMDSYGMKCGEDNLECQITTGPCSGDPGSRCTSVKVQYDWEEAPRIPSFPLLPTPDKISHSSVVEVS